VLSAVDPDMLKNLLTASAFVPVVLALLLFKFVVNAVVRTVLLVVAVGVGVIVFTQRSAVDDCVDSVGLDGATVSASCSILGFDLDLEL
jgi:hypothetical protein